MRYAKPKGNGSGWHGDKKRHSNARKYGKARGKYAKRNNIMKSRSPPAMQATYTNPGGQTYEERGGKWYLRSDRDGLLKGPIEDRETISNLNTLSDE